jgi:hypothetical protein
VDNFVDELGVPGPSIEIGNGFRFLLRFWSPVVGVMKIKELRDLRRVVTHLRLPRRPQLRRKGAMSSEWCTSVRGLGRQPVAAQDVFGHKLPGRAACAAGSLRR